LSDEIAKLVASKKGLGTDCGYVRALSWVENDLVWDILLQERTGIVGIMIPDSHFDVDSRVIVGKEGCDGIEQMLRDFFFPPLRTFSERRCEKHDRLVLSAGSQSWERQFVPNVVGDPNPKLPHRAFSQPNSLIWTSGIPTQLFVSLFLAPLKLSFGEYARRERK